MSQKQTHSSIGSIMKANEDSGAILRLGKSFGKLRCLTLKTIKFQLLANNVAQARRLHSTYIQARKMNQNRGKV
jgi:hypothetical protein